MTGEAKRMIAIAFDLMLLAGVLLIVIMLAYQGRESVNAFSELQGLRPKFSDVFRYTHTYIGFYEMTDVIDYYSPITSVNIEYEKGDSFYRVMYTNLPESGNAAVSEVRMVVKKGCSHGMSCSKCRALHDCSISCCPECTVWHKGGAVSSCGRCLPLHYEDCPTGCSSPSVKAVSYRRSEGDFIRNGVRLSDSSGYITLATDMGFDVDIEWFMFQPLKNIPGSGVLGYDFTQAMYDWTLRLDDTPVPSFLCTVQQKYDSEKVESITIRLVR